MTVIADGQGESGAEARALHTFRAVQHRGACAVRQTGWSLRRLRLTRMRECGAAVQVGLWLHAVALTTANLLQHGGSQAVRLPKPFRFEGTEVLIEKQGDKVVLKPVPARKFRSFSEIAAHLAGRFPEPEEFPEPPRRRAAHERPMLEF